ncbi:hypothetical protein EVAR_23510_1 [Eumeta japonica]|uniref:Uncharacterized protein n=1 Tax=Eumeta variegata TaxID=151549 RepID=A0A4C1W0I1_EUMVA|nr:hypothetical protein EVAR_23510_1 [Eumeta japonica]
MGLIFAGGTKQDTRMPPYVNLPRSSKSRNPLLGSPTNRSECDELDCGYELKKHGGYACARLLMKRPILALVPAFDSASRTAFNFNIGHVSDLFDARTNSSIKIKYRRPIVPLYCSALSLARSAQAQRDNESCFFVRAAGVHRFIRCYQVKNHWKLGLELVPRRGAEAVDPEDMSLVELYRVHVESAERAAASSRSRSWVAARAEAVDPVDMSLILGRGAGAGCGPSRYEFGGIVLRNVDIAERAAASSRSRSWVARGAEAVDPVDMSLSSRSRSWVAARRGAEAVDPVDMSLSSRSRSWVAARRGAEAVDPVDMSLSSRSRSWVAARRGAEAVDPVDMSLSSRSRSWVAARRGAEAVDPVDMSLVGLY